MSEIRDWFMAIPVITRAWFGASLFFPIVGRLGLLNPMYMVMTRDFIFKLQVWRPITATFWYPLGPGTGLHYLMNLYFLYNYSKNLETLEFLGRPADYLFMLTFNWVVLMLIGCVTNLFLFMDPLILSVLYVWCQLNRELIVTFWFGTRFQAKYLPWVLLGFNMLLGGGGFSEIIGIVVGHLYYYVKYKYPQENGNVQLVDTPQIFYKYLPSHTTAQSFRNSEAIRVFLPRSQESPSAPVARGATRGHNWGTGQVLGGR